MAKLTAIFVLVIVQNVLCQIPPNFISVQKGVEVIDAGKPACGCKEKPEIFHHRLKPIVVEAKGKHHNLGCDAPVIVKTAPVVIKTPGTHEIRPVVVKHQPEPLIVRKKIVKLSQPVYKKFYEEKFVKKEYPCDEKVIEEVQEPIKKPPSPCPCRANKEILLNNDQDVVSYNQNEQAWGRYL